jgi:hypothetical protein
MYVCLWSPAWSTGGESGAGESAGSRRDGGGPGAAAAGRAGGHLGGWPGPGCGEAGGAAAASAGRGRVAGAGGCGGGAVVGRAGRALGSWRRPDGDRVRTPFLVKERTGWGWRHGGERKPGPIPTDRPARRSGGGGGRAGTGVAGDAAGLGLVPDPRLAVLLDGVGIQRWALAALEREAVEVTVRPGGRGPLAAGSRATIVGSFPTGAARAASRLH